MPKFNRKLAVSLLNTDDYKNIFEKELEPINSGWIILWKGKPVKPIVGKNHYYASYNAALQGLDRNISFSSLVKDDIGQKIYGFKPYSKEWEDYFRHDLMWDKAPKSGRYSYGRDEKELTEEEVKIKWEKYDEQDKFYSFCSKALKTVLVKEWIKSGLLQIVEQ